MVKHITIAVILIILGLPSPALAAEPASGVIEGQLVNGTRDGSSVAAQGVTLETYVNDASSNSATAMSDEQGYFKFEGLSTDAAYSYDVKVTFQQGEYISDPIRFEKDDASKSVTLTVYDATTSDEAISMAMAHTVIYAEQGSAQIKEFYLVVNDSDRTFIGSKQVDSDGNRETLRFSLPAAATDFQIGYGLMDGYIKNTEDGFFDTMPVYPGGKEIVFSYRVSLNTGAYSYSRKTNYPAGRYDLLYQGERLTVTSQQLTEDAPLNIQGTLFSHFSALNVAGGTTLTATLASVTAAPTAKPTLWVVMALGVLIAAFVAVWMIRRKQLQPALAGNSLEARKQKLLSELARLDDEFEAGALPESVHKKLRSRKKTELALLIQKLRGY